MKVGEQQTRFQLQLLVTGRRVWSREAGSTAATFSRAITFLLPAGSHLSSRTAPSLSSPAPPPEFQNRLFFAFQNQSSSIRLRSPEPKGGRQRR